MVYLLVCTKTEELLLRNSDNLLQTMVNVIKLQWVILTFDLKSYFLCFFRPHVVWWECRCSFSSQLYFCLTHCCCCHMHLGAITARPLSFSWQITDTHFNTHPLVSGINSLSLCAKLLSLNLVTFMSYQTRQFIIFIASTLVFHHFFTVSF